MITTPGASAGALQQPGTANASANTLMGGTWELEGELLIDGAAFTALGANSVPARSGFGSINDLGSDPDNSSADRDLRYNPQDALCQQMSDGAPAKVILRGPAASFPALGMLELNEGGLTLDNHTLNLPGDLTNAGGSLPEFIGKGRGSLTIMNGGVLSFPGKYTQRGDAHLTAQSGGALLAGSGEFEILGGTVNASPDADVFNMFNIGAGRGLPGGTTLRVEAPLVDSFGSDSEGQPFPLSLSIGGPLTTINPGATLIVKGALAAAGGGPGIDFPGLAGLNDVSGAFRLEGDGAPNSPKLTVGILIVGGAMEVRGPDTVLVASRFQQVGTTRIGGGARVEFGSGSRVDGGDFVVEIEARPVNMPANPEGPVTVPPDFQGHLVIDFTGELADSFPDVGDSWQIVPQGKVVTGVPIGVDCATAVGIECRLNGASVPGGWLPLGSTLQTFQYQAPFGGPASGLGIRVVPAGGLQGYDDWATLGGYDQSPFGDANGNGEIDLREFFFGLPGHERSFADRYQEARMVTVANPESTDGFDRFLEMSYVRPRPVGGPSPDATYLPYYSSDLLEWFVAPMVITAISAGPFPDLERVTLRSSVPVGEPRLFARIQPSYNPEGIQAGLVPEKPLPWFGGFGGLHDPANPDLFRQATLARLGINVSYALRPGLVLYVDVTMASAIGGQVFGTGIYRDQSVLEAAVVHAGLIPHGGTGLVKLTFGEPLATYVGSLQNAVISAGINEAVPDALSYTMEAVTP